MLFWGSQIISEYDPIYVLTQRMHKRHQYSRCMLGGMFP